MKMGIFRTERRSFFQVITIGFGILFLILIVGFFVSRSSKQIQPAQQPLSTTQAYPPPGMNVTSNISVDIPVASTPQILNPKDGHALSSVEMDAMATYAYEQSLVGTPPAPDSIKEPTLSNFPILSINDLTQIIYQNASYTNPEDYFGDCILSRTPGTPVLVQSLDGDPEYYIVPYFKNNKLCVKISIEIRNGYGYVTAVGQAFGDNYPAMSAGEAIQQVILKTGKKTIGEPILAFLKSRETDPLNPFWKITTEDNQIYYVIFFTGISENSSIPETMISVLRSDEIHPLK